MLTRGRACQPAGPRAVALVPPFSQAPPEVGGGGPLHAPPPSSSGSLHTRIRYTRRAHMASTPLDPLAVRTRGPLALHWAAHREA